MIRYYYYLNNKFTALNMNSGNKNNIFKIKKDELEENKDDL